MRQISLREFRTRGAKALESVPKTETILLAGQQGPAFFLVPVMGDIAAQEKELRRAIARASLREDWLISEQSPISEAEIQQEIRTVHTENRAELKKKTA